MNVKYLISVFLCTFLLSLPSVAALADTSDSNENNNQYQGYIVDQYNRRTSSINGGMLSSAPKFDPRNKDYLTPIRDQDSTNLCWLYSTSGAVETIVSKTSGSKFNISAAHGGVASSNSISNLCSNTSTFYSNNADFGGNNAKALQYLSNWNSPIFGDDRASTWNSVVSEENYSLSNVILGDFTPVTNSFINSSSILNVTEAKYISIHDRSTIKNAIDLYGSVVTGICKYGSCVDDECGDHNYFSGRTYLSPNHSIMLVGWDDNYSKENFSNNVKPRQNGAWLVKDSADPVGYYWISYEEGSLFFDKNNVIVLTGVKKATDNEYMLSYDYLIPANDSNYFSDTIYLCNVFDVNDYIDNYEEINRVMLYLSCNNYHYDIKIVQLGSNGLLPADLENYSSLASGNYSGEGYLTVNLNQPYEFINANKCAIIIKLSPVSSTSKIRIPHEDNVEISNTHTTVPEINDGESYIGFEGDDCISWSDCNQTSSYCNSGNRGNLVIRPVLHKSVSNEHNVSITPNEIIDDSSNNDYIVQIESDSLLYSIHTRDNVKLKQDVDYLRTDSGIVIKRSYINSLEGNYTELVLEFNNDFVETVVINPRATITSISVCGNPIIGDTLSTEILGVPVHETYDVLYQWQNSPDNNSWYNIAGASSDTYVVTDNDIGRYIRVKITPTRFGNVSSPSEMYSDSSICKAVRLGDVNCDGNLTTQDSTLLQRYLAGIITLNQEQMLAADANRDGVVNINDVRVIQILIVS